MKIDPVIINIKQVVEAELLKRPGVTGVDIGRKEVGGKPTDIIAIRVLVAEKKDVPPEQTIPQTINGVPTDVIQRTFKPLWEGGIPDPLKGGCSIGNCNWPNMAGTLGALVKDNASGATMLLSCFHVMCVTNSWQVGDAIVQPSICDGGSCPNNIIGTLQRGKIGNQVDCAVARVTSRGKNGSILGIGTVIGSNTSPLEVGQVVRKFGRSTGLTYGIADGHYLTCVVPELSITLYNQIEIKSKTDPNHGFATPGDSGAVVVDDYNSAVGLLFGTSSDDYGVANPIAAVLTALDVSIPGVYINGPDGIPIDYRKRSARRLYSVDSRGLLPPLRTSWKEGSTSTWIDFQLPSGAEPGAVFMHEVSVVVTDSDGLSMQVSKKVGLYVIDLDNYNPVCIKKPWLPICRPGNNPDYNGLSDTDRA